MDLTKARAYLLPLISRNLLPIAAYTFKFLFICLLNIWRRFRHIWRHVRGKNCKWWSLVDACFSKAEEAYVSSLINTYKHDGSDKRPQIPINTCFEAWGQFIPREAIILDCLFKNRFSISFEIIKGAINRPRPPTCIVNIRKHETITIKSFAVCGYRH